MISATIKTKNIIITMIILFYHNTETILCTLSLYKNLKLCSRNYLPILIINKFSYYCNDAICYNGLHYNSCHTAGTPILLLAQLCSCWLK